MTTCLILYCLSFCFQNSPESLSLDFSRQLKVCCDIGHQDVSNRSFKCCKLQGSYHNRMVKADGVYFCEDHRRQKLSLTEGVLFIKADLQETGKNQNNKTQTLK